MLRYSLKNSRKFHSTSSIMASTIKTAGCLIIGDEVLNGKITDTNSRFFSKLCFDSGIELKSIMVVPDVKNDIIEGIQVLDKKCDFIVTSGGIGPTHDDITYESLAAAFGKKLELDLECVNRMKTLAAKRSSELNKEQLAAQYRMATLPTGSNVGKTYLDEKLWVPVVSINEKIHILPGVPQLFEKLVTKLISKIRPRITSNQFARFFVKTSMSESALAPYLTRLQNKCDIDFPHKIKIGSYPHMALKVNTISIIGEAGSLAYLRQIVEDVVKNLNGTEISAQEEDNMSRNVSELKM